MENEENQRQVSLVSHSPWKSPERDFHIPTAPATILGKVEIQKQDSHFPSVVVSLTTNSERRIPLNAGFPVVQAHRSIGICCSEIRDLIGGPQSDPPPRATCACNPWRYARASGR